METAILFTDARSHMNATVDFTSLGTRGVPGGAEPGAAETMRRAVRTVHATCNAHVQSLNSSTAAISIERSPA